MAPRQQYQMAARRALARRTPRNGDVDAARRRYVIRAIPQTNLDRLPAARHAVPLLQMRHLSGDDRLLLYCTPYAIR